MNDPVNESLPNHVPAPSLVIAGMHRSGTSLTTSLLAGAGLHVGDALMGPSAGNIRGHFEDLEFVHLHEHILAVNGLSREGYTCHEPIPVPPRLRTEAATMLDHRRRPGRAWGWKDPRTTLFLDFWANLIPEARFLFVVRPPWEVVDSLFRRGDDVFAFKPRLAVDLWVSYNSRILDFVRRHRDRCAVVETGRVAADPAGVVARVGRLLDTPLARPDPLFDAALLATNATAERRTLVEAIRPESVGLLAELRALAGAEGEAAAPVERAPDLAEAALLEWAAGIASARATRARDIADIETRLVADRDRDVAAARQQVAELSALLQASRETSEADRRAAEARVLAAQAEAEAARALLARRGRSTTTRIAAEGRRFARRLARWTCGVPRVA